MIRILLLSNRDSDNVGDQVIEATAISALRAAMSNIGVSEDGYTISSRAAGIISRNYMKTRDPALLEGARKAISHSDVVVFGGAPLFNYSYQNFYLRTIKTIELAEEYGVPVIFSSIGVEPYDPSNRKCLALKEALALPAVRQITTRDDFESLQKYVEGTDIPVAHVADPAVFADIVFRDMPSAPPKAAPRPVAPPPPTPSTLDRIKRLARRLGDGTTEPAPAPTPRLAPPPVQLPANVETPASRGQKRVGLVVTRAGIFKDNGIDFPEAKQREFWLDVIALLTERGYDYKLFTTGHFSDEAFLDTLVRDDGVPVAKAAITVNSPEELVRELKACDGVIAYRLHASITSFAYGVPSIGLSWNFKVPYFYDSVGHGDRALDHPRWTAPEVVDALEKAMAEGVTKDEAFLMTVYETLFEGLKRIFAPDTEHVAYTYEDLKSKLPRYAGTSQRAYEQKVERKMRRTYESYQKLWRFRLENAED